jgi:hypothetical protein
MEVYDGYTNKETNRNYKKFQKTETMILKGGTPKKKKFHRHQKQVQENTNQSFVRHRTSR